MPDIPIPKSGDKTAVFVISPTGFGKTVQIKRFTTTRTLILCIMAMFGFYVPPDLETIDKDVLYRWCRYGVDKNKPLIELCKLPLHLQQEEWWSLQMDSAVQEGWERSHSTSTSKRLEILLFLSWRLCMVRKTKKLCAITEEGYIRA